MDAFHETEQERRDRLEREAYSNSEQNIRNTGVIYSDEKGTIKEINTLNLDAEGEIPLPGMPDPLPVAQSAEFDELYASKSRVELELLHRFDPRTLTAVVKEGGEYKEYKGLAQVLSLFSPKKGQSYTPVRELLLKDASGVTWGARTGSADLRISEKPITQEYPLEEAGFTTQELDEMETYVLERWGRDGLARAVDMESGREYRGYEAIVAAMKQENCRLCLYEMGTAQKERKDPYVFRNITERMEGGYVADRERLISAATVAAEGKGREYETIPLQQERLIRSLAEIIEDKREAGSDFEAFALDEEGRMYRTPEEMAKQLLSSNQKNNLFLFTQNGRAPYCIRNDYGVQYISKDLITPENQLEQDKNRRYAPAGSLEPADMVVSGKKLNYLLEKRSKVNEHLKSYIPKMREDSRLKNKAEDTYFLKNKKPPRLGFFATIGNWFSKTFSHKPSRAYEAYAKRKQEYQEHVELRDTLNRRNKALNIREKQEEQQLKELDAEIEPLRKAYDARMSGGAWNKELEIREYRRHPEVLLAGVADLTEKGKITSGNIFAYTWLQKGACMGRTMEDPDAEDALYNYIAASMVQETILSNTVQNPGMDPQKDALLEHLNNGTAIRVLKRDKDLEAVLAEHKGPIDPDQIYGDYFSRVNERNQEALKPANRLMEARKELLARYGEKPITEDALVDIMRLNNLDNYLEATGRTQAIPGGKDLYFADLKDDKQNQKLGHIIGDMVKEPGKTKVIHTEEFMGPEYRKALKGVMMNSEKRLNEARQKVREQYGDLPESVREKLMPKGNMGLEQLTDLVNEAVKNKTYDHLELEPELRKDEESPAVNGPVA